MKRSIRRHYMALIKKEILREIDEIKTRHDQNNYSQEQLERYIRRAYSNEGYYVRRKNASGKHYICGCDWCVSNWTYSSQREILRIDDEENDFITLGCPPDWHYDWDWESQYYDSLYTLDDLIEHQEWDWWFEYEEKHGIPQCRGWNGKRAQLPKTTFWIKEVVDVDFSS